MFDLVITGATIVDGTGSPPFTGDIALNQDRIVAIGEVAESRGRRVIRAQGLIACPGFVDVHSHSDYFLLLNPQAESAVHQGVTTEIGGNCGYSAAPIWGEWREERARAYDDLYDLETRWDGVREYFDRLTSDGISINFGLLMGHNTIRGSTMGGAARPPETGELAAMVKAVRQGMQQGALGLSTGLIYSPACFARSDELVTLSRVAREEGGILTCHMRSEGDGLLEAIREILDVAREAQIPLQISHLKTSGERNWGKLPEALHLIEEARSLGQDVTADRYPYCASNTGLQAVLPSWALEGSRQEQVSRLQDFSVRERLRNELGDRGWDQIMIAEVTREGNKRYEGMRVDRAATLAEQEPVEFVCEILVDEETRVDAIFFTMSEENLRQILTRPYVMVASDSGTRTFGGPLSRGRPHPRAFGTFPRVLGVYVRKERLLDLSTAIRKMTFDPCRRFGLRDRGMLAPGCFADLVLFDPDRVEDRATYERPLQHPDGIRYVVVNGVLTVEEGEHTGVRAGRVLGRPKGGVPPKG
ncbi:MAG: amidohydrolase family protein [Candidatus Methylomirabilales bacterium]